MVDVVTAKEAKAEWEIEGTFPAAREIAAESSKGAGEWGAIACGDGRRGCGRVAGGTSRRSPWPTALPEIAHLVGAQGLGSAASGARDTLLTEMLGSPSASSCRHQGRCKSERLP
jgi:hypothetical protein